ncbi:GNAT family N-acetyltransferase [Nonomuraea polychroma]|uniref:GNAT family N-acetyltransferase n=1 Tax=Nonomuraea polychroma TaxID=46176 RepID=UPI003BA9109D
MLSAPGGLLLRPWEPSDAAVFLAAYQDPEIRHWHTRQPASEDQVREWFDQYRQAWAQEASRALTALSVWALGEAGFYRAQRRRPLRRPARHAPARPHPRRRATHLMPTCLSRSPEAGATL